MLSTSAFSSSAVSETTQIATLATRVCQQNKKSPLKWLDDSELKEEVETEASMRHQQLLVDPEIKGSILSKIQN